MAIKNPLHNLETNLMRNYIKNNENKCHHCRRKEIQIGKGRKLE